MNAGWLFVQGLGLGIGAAVPIGPVNVEIARQTLRRGRAAGVLLGCGAVTVDLAYAVLSSTGVSLFASPRFLTIFSCASAVLMAVLGVFSLRSAWRARAPKAVEQEDAPAPAKPPPQLLRQYATGVAMTGLNPYSIGFWFIALPGLLGGKAEHSGTDLPIICTGVVVAALAWVFGFVSVLGLLGRFDLRRWMIWTDTVGGVLLLGFAAWMAVRAIEGLT